VLLAVLVGFLLVPDGGRDDSLRIDLEHGHANEENELVARFVVKNVGTKHVTVFALDSQVTHEGSWLQYSGSILLPLELNPGELTNAIIRMPKVGRVWRMKAVWGVEPSRVSAGRMLLRQKAANYFPSLTPDWESWQSRYVHTNYFPEFSR